MSEQLNQAVNSQQKTVRRLSKFRHIHPKFKPYDKKRPKGRSGHCMVADESDIYVFGGYSPKDERNGMAQSNVLPELWKFNFASEKWTKIAANNIPSTCASACLAVHRKQVFVFGGTCYPFGQIMSNTIKTLKLNPPVKLPAAGESSHRDIDQKLSWFLLETSPVSYSTLDSDDVMPPRAYGQSLLFHKDAIYVFGGAIGYYSEAVSELHKLSIESMAWERLSPTGTVPSGRYKQEVAKDSERFYVLGGGRLNNAEGLDKIHIYHFAQNHWTMRSTTADPVHGFPKARCSFGCAQEDKNVYISGGRHYTPEIDHESLSDIWHLHLDTLQWTKLDINLPDPLYFHGSVASPAGHMYIFGGVHKDGFRSPYLYDVRLPLTLPKLGELCWDRVTKLLNKNRAMKYDNLVSLGIPWSFLERVNFS